MVKQRKYRSHGLKVLGQPVAKAVSSGGQWEEFGHVSYSSGSWYPKGKQDCSSSSIFMLLALADDWHNHSGSQYSTFSWKANLMFRDAKGHACDHMLTNLCHRSMKPQLKLESDLGPHISHQLTLLCLFYLKEVIRRKCECQ